MAHKEFAERIHSRGGMCTSVRYRADDSRNDCRWSCHQTWQTDKTLLDYYARAVTLREQRKMPEVGYCMDRRALQHVAWYCDDSNVHSLICFVCAQIYTCCTGVSEPHCEYRGLP